MSDITSQCPSPDCKNKEIDSILKFKPGDYHWALKQFRIAKRWAEKYISHRKDIHCHVLPPVLPGISEVDDKHVPDLFIDDKGWQTEVEFYIIANRAEAYKYITKDLPDNCIFGHPVIRKFSYEELLEDCEYPIE